MSLPVLDRTFLPHGFGNPRQAVIDRLRATRRSAGGAFDPTGLAGRAASDARGRGRAAGYAWASDRATLDDLHELVAAHDQVEQVRGGATGAGCACFLLARLQELLAAAAEPGPDYRDGFVSGARAVLVEVRAFV